MASTEINTQFESDFLDAMRKTDSWRRKEGILELLGGDETLLEFEINRTLLIGEWEVITPMPASQLKAADALRLRISADRKIMGRDGAQRLRGSVALTGDALFDAIRLVEPEDSEAMSEEFQDDLAELRASLESARTVLSGAGDRLLLIDRRGSVVADFAPSNLALVGTWRLECFGAGEIPEDARRPVLAISSEGLVKCRDYTKKTDMPIPRDLGSGRLDPHEYLLMTRGGRFAFRNREYVLGNDDESVVARSFRCAMARSRACVRIDDHLHVFGQKGELLMTLILIP